MDNVAISYETLKGIASSLNIEVNELDEKRLPERVSAFCMRAGHSIPRRTIYINNALPETTKSFALAHEIGHLVLGHDLMALNDALGSFKNYRKFLQNEFEANHFAGSLLISRETVRSIFTEGNTVNINAAASRFNVDYETMIYRITLMLPTKKIHFVKVDMDEKVIRRFSRSKNGIRWSSLYAPCRNTSSMRLLDSVKLYNTGATALSQISVVIDQEGEPTSTSYF